MCLACDHYLPLCIPSLNSNQTSTRLLASHILPPQLRVQLDQGPQASQSSLRRSCGRPPGGGGGVTGCRTRTVTDDDSGHGQSWRRDGYRSYIPVREIDRQTNRQTA